ncbi:MAG: hypothetical protein M3414_01840 [Pseudomonadota bacterium]|nr:hypothetical protein [Pseudomonadota bacterium]
MHIRIGLGTLTAALGLAMAGSAFSAPQAATAPADHGHATMHKKHANLDTNQDGVIDRGEAAAHPRMSAMFDRLDRNGDGKLEANDRPMHGKKGKGGHGRHSCGPMGWAVKLDIDGDGRVSKIEAADSRMAERFDAMDINRDGYLVASEIRAHAVQRRNERAIIRQQEMEAKFTAADSNGDGKLSRAEVDAAMPHVARAFAFLDEDRDGFLTRVDIAPERK